MKNATRNVFWGIIEKIFALILPFAVKTIIIKVLGVEYLGINSLFASILTVLSLSNLGFDTAIVFSMYKPIAENDDKTVCALLNTYKKIYRIVGIIILACGACVIPFLPNLIKGSYPSNVNIYILYLITLFDTVLGYFLFAYKGSLFRAYQRNDVTSKRGVFLNLISNAAQIVLLLTFRNYYAYVMVAPVICITTNLINAYLAKKMFPNITPEGKISVDMKKDITKRVAGLVSFKIYSVVFSSVDTIVISAFLGLKQLAVYNSYYYIQTTINNFVAIFTNSIVAGIGHKMKTNSIEDNYTDFKGLVFINGWISGWSAVCLICLYQPFMKLWLGENMIFGIDTVILLVLLFLLPRLSVMSAVYRESAGLWWEDKFRLWIATAVNLATNIFLVRHIGLNGVIISTLICTIFINIPWGTYVLFKKYFKRSMKEYLQQLLFYLIITTVVAIITYIVCGIFSDNGFLNFIVKGIICIIMPNTLYFLAYKNLPEYKFFKDVIRRVLNNLLKRK